MFESRTLGHKYIKVSYERLVFICLFTKILFIRKLSLDSSEEISNSLLINFPIFFYLTMYLHPSKKHLWVIVFTHFNNLRKVFCCYENLYLFCHYKIKFALKYFLLVNAFFIVLLIFSHTLLYALIMLHLQSSETES